VPSGEVCVFLLRGEVSLVAYVNIRLDL
jgi:hypothetical protein